MMLSVRSECLILNSKLYFVLFDILGCFNIEYNMFDSFYIPALLNGIERNVVVLLPWLQTEVWAISVTLIQLSLVSEIYTPNGHFACYNISPFTTGHVSLTLPPSQPKNHYLDNNSPLLLRKTHLFSLSAFPRNETRFYTDASYLQTISMETRPLSPETESSWKVSWLLLPHMLFIYFTY